MQAGSIKLAPGSVLVLDGPDITIKGPVEVSTSGANRHRTTSPMYQAYLGFTSPGLWGRWLKAQGRHSEGPRWYQKAKLQGLLC